MVIYRYMFWLALFSSLLLLAWLMMPERKQPADILNVTPTQVSALKRALEGEGLAEVAQSLPAKLREEAKIVIQAPTFVGADKAGFKWHITAEKAYQERNSTLLALENITARRGVDDMLQAVTLSAAKGMFDDQQSLLHLTAGFTGTVRGLAISGRTGLYKLNDQQASGGTFTANGENGQLLAQLFEADLLEQTAYFTGGVKMQIKLKTNSGAAK